MFLTIFPSPDFRPVKFERGGKEQEFPMCFLCASCFSDFSFTIIYFNLYTYIYISVILIFFLVLARAAQKKRSKRLVIAGVTRNARVPRRFTVEEYFRQGMFMSQPRSWCKGKNSIVYQCIV